MEVEERSEISVDTLKKKGRPTKGTVSAAKEKNIVVSNLTDQNYKYLSYVHETTNHSLNSLVNQAVEHARKNDIFVNLDMKEPAYITKAREALGMWEKSRRKLPRKTGASRN